MNKKLGPLPVWVWAGTAIAVAAVIYLRARSSSSSAAAAVDPAAPGDQLGAGTDLSGALPQPTDPGAQFLPQTVTADGAPDTTFTDLGQAGAGPAPTPVDLTGGFLDQLVGFGQIAAALGFAPAAQNHPGSAAPAARRKPPKRRAATKKAQRAPAHPHEQQHAAAPSHLREPAAHTRVRAPQSVRPKVAQPAAPHAPGAAPHPVSKPKAPARKPARKRR